MTFHIILYALANLNKFAGILTICTLNNFKALKHYNLKSTLHQPTPHLYEVNRTKILQYKLKLVNKTTQFQ